MKDLTTIRIAHPNDINALVKLEGACFSTDHISSRQFRYLLQAATAHVLIAENMQKIVASMVALFRKNSKTSRLYSLAVNPVFQKKGIAKALCELIEIESVKRNCSQIYLEVRKDNNPAINFYQNNGYRLLGERKKYYEDGGDALRLCKDLLFSTTSYPSSEPKPGDNFDQMLVLKKISK